MNTSAPSPDHLLLEEKAKVIEALVEDCMIAPSGVVYSQINSDTGRPWSAEDWREDYRFLEIPDTTPWDVLGFENCGMVTGAYLAAMTFKFKMTGSAEALAVAGRTYEGLAHIYGIGKTMEEGFFPKIYGGKFTRQTSSDQYLYAMKAMKIYHDIAAPDQQAQIEEMVGAMADFWMKRAYHYGYYTIPDMLWPLGRFPSFMIMAHALTGDQKFLDEFDRLNREHEVYRHPADSILSHRAARSGFTDYEKLMGKRYLLGAMEEAAAMDIMSLDECLKHSDAHRENWLSSMRQMWREGQLGLAPQGMSYRHVLYDPHTGAVSPIPAPYEEPASGPVPAGSLQWDFFSWFANILLPRGVMLARAGVNVDRWLPGEKAREIASRILTEAPIELMRARIDPDGNQLLPRHSYMANSLCGDALVNWLWAYWEGAFQSKSNKRKIQP